MERKFFGFSKNVFFAGLVSLFMDISSEMVYPLVPLFLVGVLGVTKTTVGIIEGMAESAASLLKVFSGYVSDITKKRKLPMTLGYAISCISRPVLYIASGWGGVFTARFIDRVGKGIRTSPRDALIVDSTESANLGKAFGLHRAMDTIGGIIGPGVAAVLLIFFAWARPQEEAWGMRIVFLLATIPGLIAVSLIIIFIKEKKSTTQPSEKRPAQKKSGSKSILNGPLWHYMAAIAVFSLGNTSDVFLILRAENMGVEKEIIPLLYLFFNVIYALTSIPMGFIADRIGLKRMLVAGFFFYSLIYAGFAFAASDTHIWALFALYGLFKGMTDGTQRAYLAGLVPSERIGTAFGIFHTTVGISLLPASIIGGILWDTFGAPATFFYGASASFIALIIFIIPIKKRS